MTVASLPTMSTSRPETRPMPVTRPAAGASPSYMSRGGKRLKARGTVIRGRAAYRFARGPGACPGCGAARGIARHRPAGPRPCAPSAPPRAASSARGSSETQANRVERAFRDGPSDGPIIGLAAPVVSAVATSAKDYGGSEAGLAQPWRKASIKKLQSVRFQVDPGRYVLNANGCGRLSRSAIRTYGIDPCDSTETPPPRARN